MRIIASKAFDRVVGAADPAVVNKAYYLDENQLSPSMRLIDDDGEDGFDESFTPVAPRHANSNTHQKPAQTSSGTGKLKIDPKQ